MQDQSANSSVRGLTCAFCKEKNTLVRKRNHRFLCMNPACKSVYPEEQRIVKCPCGRKFRTWKKGRLFCSNACRLREFRKVSKKIPSIVRTRRRFIELIRSIESENMLERGVKFLAEELLKEIKVIDELSVKQNEG